MNGIGLGVVGLNMSRGWALTAHYPALCETQAFDVRAVSTTRRESAEAAAKALGAPRACDNAAALIADPEVQLVAVLVHVSQHYPIAKAALEAGKMVFCEWPLGASLEQAEELAALAQSKGLRTFIGLQGRTTAPFRYVRDLVAEGYVGRVLSTTLVQSPATWGEELSLSPEEAVRWTGYGNMLTISLAHSLDAICAGLGELESVSAVMAERRYGVRRADTGQRVPGAGPDQLALAGVLRGGAVFSAHMRGGRSRATPALWEITGTEGDILVTSATGRLHYGELRVQGARGEEVLHDLPIPDSYRLRPGEPETGGSLGHLYAQIAADLRDGTNLTMDFAHAAYRHRVIEAIRRAAETGVRQDIVGGRGGTSQ